MHMAPAEYIGSVIYDCKDIGHMWLAGTDMLHPFSRLLIFDPTNPSVNSPSSFMGKFCLAYVNSHTYIYIYIYIYIRIRGSTLGAFDHFFQTLKT